MKWYVYVLVLKNWKWYYGSTRDVRMRYREHKKGNVKSTRWQEPKILSIKEFETLEDARKFEMYLKKSRNKKYIMKLMDIKNV